MSTYKSLLSECHLEPTESHRRETCGACGTIMIPGLAAVMVSQRRLKRRGKGKNDVPPDKSIVFQCNCCKKKTRHELPTSLPRHKPRKTTTANLNSVPFPSVSTTSKPPSIPVASDNLNISSKKRAKARKQSGLQALLAKQKASQGSSSGFGLDLSDFMKK